MGLDHQVLWAFTLLWLAILPTPGANSLIIVHLALTSSWRSVAAALIGNLCGIACYAMATLLGLAWLLAAAPSVRLAIYGLGGLYLLWVGARLAWRGLKRAQEAERMPAPAQAPSAAGAFAHGLLTALSNVQALFFLASIFASVGVLSVNFATRLAVVAVIVVGNGAYLTLLAWLMRKPAVRNVYNRYQPGLEVVFGALFMLFGARLVAREWAGWL
jgi:threonine/homoserine/homoserine lactone efflux protein